MPVQGAKDADDAARHVAGAPPPGRSIGGGATSHKQSQKSKDQTERQVHPLTRIGRELKRLSRDLHKGVFKSRE